MDPARGDRPASLQYVGRRDGQLSVRGHRVEPAQVRAAVLAVPGVRDAAVALAGDGELPVLTAWVVWEPEQGTAGDAGAATPDAAAVVRAHVAARQPAHLVPGAVAVVDALPLTANGKRDRTRLPAVVVGVADDDAAAGPVAARLSDLWAEITGVRVGLDVSLVAAGGHSLAMVRLADRIERIWGVELTLPEVLRAASLRHLAATVEQSLAADGSEPVDLEELVAALVDGGAAP